MATEYKTAEWKGTGSYGEVWVCVRSTDGQKFAKKELPRESELEDQRRFKREVRILSKLDHPNIVKVIDIHLDQQPLYYVMPLYKGNLHDEIPKLVGDENRIYITFSAILDAVEYAHQQGIIHRDLKAGNILINNDNDIVVADFGFGRILDSTSIRDTKTGISFGTYFYMAPEQTSNAKNADERSDIYSLGRMLYELYTGPLDNSVQDTSSLPTGIKIIIDRCTHKDPDRRFRTLADLKSAWHDLFDISRKETELDELLLLRAELTAGQSANEGSIERFLELLIKYQKESDLVLDTFMQVDSSVIVAMYEENCEVMGHLLKGFIEDLKSQDWPFDYTDKIGNKCKSIYQLIENDELRALLIDCVLNVGAKHNRWHVLRIFGSLIRLPKSRDELIILSELLNNTEEWIRKSGAYYIGIKKIGPPLREYFEFNDEDEEDFEPEF